MIVFSLFSNYWIAYTWLSFLVIPDLRRSHPDTRSLNFPYFFLLSTHVFGGDFQNCRSIFIASCHFFVCLFLIRVFSINLLFSLHCLVLWYLNWHSTGKVGFPACPSPASEVPRLHCNSALFLLPFQELARTLTFLPGWRKPTNEKMRERRNSIHLPHWSSF